MNFSDKFNQEFQEEKKIEEQKKIEEEKMKALEEVLKRTPIVHNEFEEAKRSLNILFDAFVYGAGKMYETLKGKLSSKQIKEIIIEMIHKTPTGI